jgi:uncharacterized cupredoxin-like copper-binding protein
MKNASLKSNQLPTLPIMVIIGTLLFNTAALAHGPSGHRESGGTQSNTLKEQTAWGIAGDSKQVTRTIQVVMSDKMRFAPDVLTVKKGETIRFEVRNAGKVLHEMVIGTRQELDAHAEMMKKHPNMEHDEAYMAHVSAGKKADIVWHFNREGDFEFACLISGHYEAGMRGKIKVTL